MARSPEGTAGPSACGLAPQNPAETAGRPGQGEPNGTTEDHKKKIQSGRLAGSRLRTVFPPWERPLRAEAARTPLTWLRPQWLVRRLPAVLPAGPSRRHWNRGTSPRSYRRGTLTTVCQDNATPTAPRLWEFAWTKVNPNVAEGKRRMGILARQSWARPATPASAAKLIFCQHLRRPGCCPFCPTCDGEECSSYPAGLQTPGGSSPHRSGPLRPPSGPDRFGRADAQCNRPEKPVHFGNTCRF